MYTNLFQKLTELGKVSSFCKFQLLAVNYKEIAAIKKIAKLYAPAPQGSPSP